jgi:MFS family permease
MFLAQLVSSMGTAAGLLAVAYASYHHANSIIHTVIVATAYGLPAALVAPLAARIADTKDWRRVIVVGDLAIVATWIGLVVLDLVEWLNPTWLTLASLLTGTAGALVYPSWHEFERAIAPGDRLGEANAVLSSAGSIARVAGAVIGGFVLTWTGPAVLFGFNALSYVPLMFVVTRMRYAHEPRPPGSVRRVGLHDALTFARRQPMVRDAIEIVIVLTLLAVPIASLLPAIADEFGDEAHHLGLLTAFYSIGGSLVAAVLTRLSKRFDTSVLTAPAVLTCGLSLAVIGVLGDVLGSVAGQIVVVALLIPIGLGLAMAQAVLSSTVQLASTPEIESEVLALYSAAVSLVAPIGALTLAMVTELRSVWLAVAVSGGLLALLSILRIVRKRAGAAGGSRPAVRRTILEHAAQLGRFAEGFLHPGQYRPVTGRDADRGAPSAGDA